jgi:hypothetical protein
MHKAKSLFDRVSQRVRDHYAVGWDYVDVRIADDPTCIARQTAALGINEDEAVLAIRRRQYLDGGFVRREVYQISRRPGHYRPALTRKVAKEVPLVSDRPAGRKPDAVRQIIYVAAMAIANSELSGACRQEKYASVAEMLGFGRDAGDRIEKYCSRKKSRGWSTARVIGVDLGMADLSEREVIAIASIAGGEPASPDARRAVESAVTLAEVKSLQLIHDVIELINAERSLMAGEKAARNAAHYNKSHVEPIALRE